jgi:hypothetical protein
VQRILHRGLLDCLRIKQKYKRRAPEKRTVQRKEETQRREDLQRREESRE